MRALIDTNVLMDYVVKREPYFAFARSIVDARRQNVFDGCVAAHSFTNMFYILRKVYDDATRRAVLLNLTELFDVGDVNKNVIVKALENQNFPDFEDCVQSEVAEKYRADYIVTRNPKDFENSRIPCISPEDFIKLLK